MIKRIFDTGIALTLMPVWITLTLCFCVGVMWESSGLPLYFQKRMGKNLQPFRIVKIRTMTDGRVSGPFAAWLRKRHLDELPQFVNVLIGQMSLVGPRALPYQMAINFLDKMPGFDIRYEVMPGITGPTQTRGRLEKIGELRAARLDVLYARRCCFWGDIGIMFKTPFAMWRCIGV